MKRGAPVVGRFYFDLHDQTGFVEDDEGREFATLGNAREAAVKGARSIMSQEVAEGVLDLNGRIEVFDGDRRHVLTLQFREAVQVKM